jgi:hypothetical protein
MTAQISNFDYSLDKILRIEWKINTKSKELVN